MKKSLLLTTSLLAVIALSACSSKPNDTTPNSDSSSKVVKSDTTTKASSQKNTPTSVDDFYTALVNSGLTVTETIEKEAAMIQAESGKGFVLDDGSSVEVYEYKDGEAFDDVKASQELLGQPVTIYGHFVVMIVNETTHSTDIEKAFSQFN